MKETAIIPAQSSAIVDISPNQTIGTLADEHAGRTAHSRYAEKKSLNTIRRQKADLNLFFRYLASIGYEYPIGLCLSDLPHAVVTGHWEYWQGITHGLVELFMLWQKEQGYAIGSMNVRLATVKTYCELAHKAGALRLETYAGIKIVSGYSHQEGVHIDRARPVSRVGEKKAEPTSVNAGHATLLKRQPDTAQGRRDAAMLCLLLDHGLRCSELASLTRASLNLADGTLTFYREKVDIRQIHRLTPDSLVAIMAYLPDVTGPYLFPGYKGKAITTRGINKRVGQLGAAIGLQELSPHDLRHYWATIATRSGTDLKALQTAGGWKSPAMPLRYAEANKIANEGVKLS